MRDSGLQMPKSPRPVLTYPNVRSAPVLDFAIFGALWRILERTPDREQRDVLTYFAENPDGRTYSHLLRR
jgi:hypothetical protein